MLKCKNMVHGRIPFKLDFQSIAKSKKTWSTLTIRPPPKSANQKPTPHGYPNSNVCKLSVTLMPRSNLRRTYDNYEI